MTIEKPLQNNETHSEDLNFAQVEKLLVDRGAKAATTEQLKEAKVEDAFFSFRDERGRWTVFWEAPHSLSWREEDFPEDCSNWLVG